MKHCPTCQCEVAERRERILDPDCPTCKATNNLPRWDIHGAAERIARGEVTSSAIAREVGISRQAVEQGLKKHYLSHVVQEGAAARARIRNEKKEKERRVNADSPRRYSRKGVSAQKYTDEFLLQSLQAMHRFLNLGSQGMPHELYAEMRPSNLPSSATIMDRFGSWNRACSEAGLPVNEPIRDNYTQIPREKAVDDVKRFVVEYREQHGRYASVGAGKYEKWAMVKKNRAVSRALIAKRWGWTELLQDAFQELYGDAPVASG